MAMYAKKMTPASPPLLLQRPTVSRMPSNKNSAVHTSCRGHHPFAFGVLLLLSTVLLFSSHGSDTEAAPSPTLARHGGCCVAFVGSFAGGYVGAASLGLGGRLCPHTLALVRRRNGRARISAQRRRGARMAAAGEKEEEKMELAAEVVGAVTKAAVGVAVGRAAATVSEEQGLPPPARGVSREAAGAKRKALVGVLSSFLAFLRSDATTPSGTQAWGFGEGSDPRHGSAAPGSIASQKETMAGVMVNGYWFPSLAAAAEAPAGQGFDFAQAVVDAGKDAIRAKREKQRMAANRRWVAEAALSKGVDFSCGAVLLSCPTPYVLDDPDGASDAKSVAGVGGSAGDVLPPWRRWTVNFMEKTGITARMQQAIRDSVPRMPKEALMLVVGVAGGELAKREINAQVEALEDPVKGPAWALLNETYRNVEAWGAELVESNWDYAALLTRQLADWKRRGVGNSLQEALLKEVIELQTRALLRPITLPADEGSLMIQLNATYRNIEESIGRLLPQQTREQLSLLEALVRKLDEKGIGELSFDEVYRALLLGAVPPALVTDAVRLLATGRPREEGGASFLPGETSSFLGAGDVTLASLAARLNDTEEVTRVMTYTALAAETEVIENLREVLEGLQSNIRKSLEDIESDLVRSAPAQPSGLQGAASYVNHAARSAVTFAKDGFDGASKVFDASFEALAEPSRRTLLKSSELFPWQSWYEAWTNITKGEDNLFGTAGQKLTPVSLLPADGYHEEIPSSFSTNAVSASTSASVGNKKLAGHLSTVKGKEAAVNGDEADRSSWSGRFSSVRDAVAIESPPRNGGDSLVKAGGGRGRLKKWRTLPLLRWLKKAGSDRGAPRPRGSSPESIAGLGKLTGDRPGDGLSNVGSVGGGGGGGGGGGNGSVGSGAAARPEPPARAVRRGAKRWRPEAKRRNLHEDADGDALEGESGGGGGVAGSREFRRKRWKG